MSTIINYVELQLHTSLDGDHKDMNFTIIEKRYVPPSAANSTICYV